MFDDPELGVAGIISCGKRRFKLKGAMMYCVNLCLYLNSLDFIEGEGLAVWSCGYVKVGSVWKLNDVQLLGVMEVAC